MSKALLVIDMPNECMECTLRYKDGDTDDWFRFRCHISDDQVQKGERLENCPLKPMPEKRITDLLTTCDFGCGFDTGYNACIDEILGGTDNE